MANFIDDEQSCSYGSKRIIAVDNCEDNEVDKEEEEDFLPVSIITTNKKQNLFRCCNRNFKKEELFKHVSFHGKVKNQVISLDGSPVDKLLIKLNGKGVKNEFKSCQKLPTTWGNQIIFGCKVCKVKMPFACLIVHKQEHRRRAPYGCELCSMRSQSMSNVKEHIMDCHFDKIEEEKQTDCDKKKDFVEDKYLEFDLKPCFVNLKRCDIKMTCSGNSVKNEEDYLEGKRRRRSTRERTPSRKFLESF